MAKIVAGAALIAGAVALTVMTGGVGAVALVAMSGIEGSLFAGMVAVASVAGAELLTSGIMDALNFGAGTGVAVRGQSAHDWIAVYGRQRVGGAQIDVSVANNPAGGAGSTNVWMWEVFAHACHQVEAMDAVYMNGQQAFCQRGVNGGFNGLQGNLIGTADTNPTNMDINGMSLDIHPTDANYLEYHNFHFDGNPRFWMAQYDGTQTEADPFYMAWCAVNTVNGTAVPHWNANCVLAGTAYSIFRYWWNSQWGGAPPAVQVDIRGKNNIYDPRIAALTAAPQAVYQSSRYGPCTYTIPGMDAASSYRVCLLFAESYWTAIGQRQFNVILNGTQVLTNFDIFAAAGGANISFVEQFATVANSSGDIVIEFTNGAADQPTICGIVILEYGNAALSINCGGGVEGTFQADEYFSGGLTATVTNAINTSGPTPMAYVYTENAALILADYLTNTQFGAGFLWSEINIPQLIAAANICDEQIELAKPMTINGYTVTYEPQFSICGCLDSGQTSGVVINNMLSAMAGNLSYVGGQWSIFPGVWYGIPAAILTQGDFLAPLKYSPKKKARDLYNEIRAQFVSPAAFTTTMGPGIDVYQNTSLFDNFNAQWTLTDMVPFSENPSRQYGVDQWLLQDGGTKYIHNTKFPFTISHACCQRLSKIMLRRNRWQGVGTIYVPLAQINTVPVDNIEISYPRYSWDGKLFAVVDTQIIPGSAQHTGEMSSPMYKIDFVETDPSIYEWSTTDELQLTPNGMSQAGPSTPMVQPPTNLVLESGAPTLQTTTTGLSLPTILCTWTAPEALYNNGQSSGGADALVVDGGHYLIQFQTNGASFWNTAAQVAGDTTSYTIGGIPEGTICNVRIMAVRWTGLRSEWVQAGPITVSGSTLNIAATDVYYTDGSSVETWQPATTNADSTRGQVATLILNPGFESGALNWTLGAGWAVVNNPALAHSGSYSAEFTGSVAAPIVQQPQFFLGAINTFSLACFINPNGSAGSGSVRVNIYNAAGTLLSTIYGSNVAGGTTGYQLSTMTLQQFDAGVEAVAATFPYHVLPAGCYFTVDAYITGNAGAPWYVDDFSLTTTDTSLRSLVTGAPVNLVPDSSVQFGGAYWSAPAGSLYTVATGVSAIGGQNGFQFPATANGVANQLIASAPIPVTPGQTYTLSGFIDATQVSAGSPMLAIYSTNVVSDPSGATLYASVDGTAGVAARASTTWTCPAGVTQICVAANLNGCTINSGQFVTFALPQLQQGATMTGYSTTLVDSMTGTMQHRAMSTGVQTAITPTGNVQNLGGVAATTITPISGLMPSQAGADVTAQNANILLQNPNFEAGNVGWTIQEGGVISSGGGFNGSGYSLKSTGGTLVAANNQLIPCSAGAVLSATALFNAPTGTAGGADVRIAFFDAAGSITNWLDGSTAVANGTPQQSRLVLTAGAGTAYAQIFLVIYSAAVGWTSGGVTAAILPNSLDEVPNGSTYVRTNNTHVDGSGNVTGFVGQGALATLDQVNTANIAAGAVSEIVVVTDTSSVTYTPASAWQTVGTVTITCEGGIVVIEAQFLISCTADGNLTIQYSIQNSSGTILWSQNYDEPPNRLVARGIRAVDLAPPGNATSGVAETYNLCAWAQISNYTYDVSTVLLTAQNFRV